MRLHPAVTYEEALEWLLQQAHIEGTDMDASALEANLKPFAEAMALISSVELPVDLEPSFP